MKLLFDQNISPKIVKQISSLLPGSTQVRFVGLENASDIEIFQHAKSNRFTIVTFDSDFVDLNTIYGVPPKVIWLRTGNITTPAISDLINRNILSIKEFIQNDSDEILEISNAP